MIKKSIVNLPLHGGKAPYWLFSRMKKLAREIILLIIKEYGADEVINRLSDPAWFQAFGCVLGFDWHSSGLTTTVTSALKEGLKDVEKDIGLFIAGGKGNRSRKTPEEIITAGEKFNLDVLPYIKISRLTAKVDNTAIQDGYQLYHHVFIFTKNNKWAVIQQGMNPFNKFARRYHWLSDNVKDFTEEPHKAICAEKKEKNVLNMVAKESRKVRMKTIEISKEKPEKILKEVKIIEKLDLPKRHNILDKDINNKNLEKILLDTYEKNIKSFEELLLIKGMGPKTLRSLVLIAELIYNEKPSYKDPVTYSFAHGGKDGIPYPVNKKLYDKNIEFLREIVNSSKIDYTEKTKAFKRLSKFFKEIKNEGN